MVHGTAARPSGPAERIRTALTPEPFTAPPRERIAHLPDTTFAMTSPGSGASARFELLYAEARDPLVRYLARRAAPDQVEDLFAETMTVAWRRLPEIPAGAEIPWLYGTARRVLANHRRASGRFGRLVERLAVLGRGEDDGPAVPPVGDPDLADALAALSATDAEILRLWAWEELAPAGMAVVLGISPNAASIRLHRAKGRLRERLEAARAAGGKTAPVAGHVPGVERKEAR
jgi:RNA polymerase sigma-70 factor, ECF subfamily